MTQHARSSRSRVGALIAGAAVLAFAALWCQAQQAPAMDPRRADPLTTNPRGLTQPPIGTPSFPVQQPTTDAATLLTGDDAAPADGEAMFGEQLFRPGAPQAYGAGFNPDYMLAIGDRVALRMWGAFTYEAIQPLDAQGNVFLPNVGPIHVAGVRNADLNEVVQASVRKVYRSNVGVYASLEASQPVRVYVTGFVVAPGQYAGLAAESVLGYLARAGGVDPRSRQLHRRPAAARRSAAWAVQSLRLPAARSPPAGPASGRRYDRGRRPSQHRPRRRARYSTHTASNSRTKAFRPPSC